MKRTRRTLPPAEREQAAAFKESVQGRPCVRCGKTRSEMEAHHAIEAQFLRDRFPDHVYDKRNAVPLCPWWIDPACHGDHTSRMRPLKRSVLPESVEEFAAELDLVWYLEQRYSAPALFPGGEE